MSTELEQVTETVYLWQASDLRRIKELEEATTEAVASTGARRVGDVVPGAAEAQARDEFVREARERAVVCEMGPLGRKAWRTMLEAHPARPESDVDKQLGFNEETLADDLVPACLLRPEFPDPAKRDAWIDSLSHGRFSRLYSAAHRVNAEFGPDPKDDLAGRLERIYAETSESSDGSEPG